MNFQKIWFWISVVLAIGATSYVGLHTLVYFLDRIWTVSQDDLTLVGFAMLPLLVYLFVQFKKSIYFKRTWFWFSVLLLISTILWMLFELEGFFGSLNYTMIGLVALLLLYFIVKVMRGRGEEVSHNLTLGSYRLWFILTTIVAIFFLIPAILVVISSLINGNQCDGFGCFGLAIIVFIGGPIGIIASIASVVIYRKSKKLNSY